MLDPAPGAGHTLSRMDLDLNPSTRTLYDAARPADDDAGPRPVRVTRWRADRDDAPLILLSHGVGGSMVELAWWAEGLCAAGFDVVGVDHHGTSYVAGKSVRGLLSAWDRPLDLSFVLDQVEVLGQGERRPVAGRPVGAAGFSLGGYTAAAVCGARLSGRAFETFDDGAGALPVPPEFPDFAEGVAALRASGDRQFWASAPRRVAAELRDRRVRAGFLLCPALGPLLDDAATARGVDVPVAVRWTAADTQAPPALNALRYARAVSDVDAAPVGGPASGHYGFVLDEDDDPVAKADVLRDSIGFFTRTLEPGAAIGGPARGERGIS